MGGDATLVGARDRLLALACPPPGRPKLLPIVSQTIPKLWEPAIACVRTVRDVAPYKHMLCYEFPLC